MKRAVALGFFDGVHIGHGALLSKTKECAARAGLMPCVMTYSRHPSAVLFEKTVPLINSTEERLLLISELYGIDDIVVKDFTSEYAATSCEDFFRHILIEELDAGFIVAGFDFRFGAGGRGDADTLRSLCEENGIGCEIVPAVIADGSPVSSTRIREHLASGEIHAANELLGHFHCIISPVVHGNHLGSTLGFATANQHISEDVGVPKPGVYVSRVTVGEKTFNAVTNLGRRPTVTDESGIFAETHIPDFNGDIYGEVMKTELLHFLREEKKFSSAEELRRQISQDVAAARQLF